MNKNSTLIIGKNKTGKTRKVLFEEVKEKINNNENLLVLDERLEYYNEFGQELEEKGYDIKVVNFKEPSKSDGWNPFGYVTHLYNSGKIDKAIEALKSMGEYIFKNKVSGADPFWTDMATNYFIGLSLILLKISKEKNDITAVEFYSLLQIMNQGEEKYKDSTYLKEYCSKLDSTDPICLTLNSIMNAPEETRGSIIAVFKSKVNNYFMRPELVSSFNNNYFHVEHLDNEGKKAIFIVNYKPLASLSNILIEQLIGEMDNIDAKFNIILDGFDKFPKFNDIEEIIDKVNHTHINIYLTTINKENLINKYNGYTFFDIENIVELNNIYEENISSKEYMLPELKNHPLSKFDFKKYI